MKKIFFTFILAVFVVLESSAVSANMAFHIHLIDASGTQLVLSAGGLSKSDLVWSLTNVTTGRTLRTGAQATGEFWSNVPGLYDQVGLNMAMFDAPGMGGWSIGNDMIFEVTVSKPGNPYHDAVATVTFKADSKTLSFINVAGYQNGILLKGIPKVTSLDKVEKSVSSKTTFMVCKSLSKISDHSSNTKK